MYHINVSITVSELFARDVSVFLRGSTLEQRQVNPFDRKWRLMPPCGLRAHAEVTRGGGEVTAGQASGSD